MLFVPVLFLAAALDCRVVIPDQIHMRDLAAVAPAFSAVEPEVVVAYAPLPGATRIMHGAELANLARKYGLEESDYRDVCFQRSMRQLDGGELSDVLSRALAVPNAQLELVDYSRFPAPRGELVFPRSGLALTPGTVSLLWKGYVLYGDGRHFPIWARVHIRARLKRVVATDNLVTHSPVRSDQVRIEALDGVPDTLAPAQSLDQVVGKILLRPVRRGTSISLDDISTAITIHRGDKVQVDFESPGMHLRFEAAAEMDGRFGDQIRLRNLQSNATFVAQVSGKDEARVLLDQQADRNGAPRGGTDDSAGRAQKEAQGAR